MILKPFPFPCFQEDIHADNQDRVLSDKIKVQNCQGTTLISTIHFS